MGGCAWPAIRRSERSIARTYSKCHVLSGPGASGRRQPDRVSTEKHSSGMHIFESHSLDDAPPRRVGSQRTNELAGVYKRDLQS